MSADSPRRSPQKSHALLIAACVTVMLAAVGVILECRGPFRGWLGATRGTLSGLVFGRPSDRPPRDEFPADHGSPSGRERSASPPASVPVVPPPGPLPSPVAVPSSAGSDLASRYSQLYAECLARLPQPVLGEVCRFTLVSGEKVHGRLAKVEPGRVTLRMEHGTLSYPMGVIRQSDVLRLFPETAARVEAMAALRRETAGGGTPPEPEEPAEAEAPTVPQVAGPDPRPTPLPSKEVPGPGTQGYDPTPGPTPEHLKPTLAAFAEWLNTQHRRVGGRIADKIYAKRQAGRTVLYLRMDPMFMAQDYSTRYQIAEGMQIFWALRCQGDGIAGMGAAHVVLLNQDNHIVGGSRPNAPTDIWLQGQ